jgi:hypothetical protein
MKRTFLELTVPIAVAVLVTLPAGLWSDSAAGSGQTETIELPQRISRRPTPPPSPPELPARANELSPLSFEWVSAWEGPNGARGRKTQTVLRTADRILVVLDGGANEWLFERNPVDPRRVSGYLIDHPKRQVLVHHDSDLRTKLRLRGWTDALTLGFDAAILVDLRATGEHRSVGGVSFERYVAPQTAAPGVVEVWWSESLLMPLQLTVREGEVERTSMLEALDTRVQTERLGDPRRRFPGYAVLDIADLYDAH